MKTAVKVKPKCVLCNIDIRRKKKEIKYYEGIGYVQNEWWTGTKLPDGNWVCRECESKLSSD